MPEPLLGIELDYFEIYWRIPPKNPPSVDSKEMDFPCAQRA
jgi:hypothetical protein